MTDKFVWLRVIKANDLDLKQFQFDYELTFAVIFMNADKTIYGRYGSRRSRKNAESDVSVEGLAESMKAVLQLHQGYPRNLRFLKGKQAKPTPYKTPLEIPALRGKYKRDLNFTGKVVQSCVHCHQVTESQRQMARLAPKPMPIKLVYPYPGPTTVGFSLDPKKRATVTGVQAGSPAAGVLQKGDELLTISGQAIVSQADVQWVLHHAETSDQLPLLIRRDGKLLSKEMVLPAKWRHKTEIGWRTGGWELRRMALGGMKLAPATPAQRRAAGVGQGELALVADYVGQYGLFGTAKRLGFRKGDMLVKYGPLTGNITESQLLGWAALNTRPGQRLSITFVRNGRRMTRQFPMQK